MTTISISKEVEFDAGHRVPNHVSKCSNPHGHRYRVVAHCVGEIIEDPTHPEDGMLIDFGRLKSFLTEIHDIFDHGFIYHERDEVMANAFANMYKLGDTFKVVVLEYVPTAENLARWIFNYLNENIADEFGNNLRLSKVTVYETPTSQATYGHDS